MGVSGAGKTTVGKRLAKALDCPFVEGDELHPASNVEKMRRGTPLTDEDRAPWLARLRERISGCLQAAQSAVISCSALRRVYRKQLRVDPRVRFVYLKGDYELLRQRLQRRSGHFMKAAMLKSQLETLEEPEDAITVDAALPVDEIVARVRQTLAI